MAAAIIQAQTLTGGCFNHAQSRLILGAAVAGAAVAGAAEAGAAEAIKRGEGGFAGIGIEFTLPQACYP